MRNEKTLVAILALAILAMVTAQIVAADSGTIEQFNIADGVLVGVVSYPDGGVVVVTLGDGTGYITTIPENGMMQTVSFALMRDNDIKRASVTANGRAVHLVIEGARGVRYHRYWIPDEMAGLDVGHPVFIPLVMSED